eukprot:GHVR01100142.1.p2 GENE.GHVR01100142.1~~GHVR01100142.1.p2  ORF type:complete len:184 (-),score=18.28 GHVR01100142.1:87-638(-)
MKQRRKTDRGRIEDLEQRVRRTVGTASSTVTINGAVVSNNTPQAIGTASAGVATDASRSDHVHTDTSALVFVFDGGGSALTTDPVCDVYIPFACTIISSTLLADQSGDAVLDVEKDTYANYPPTGGDSIVASAPPTLSSATKAQDATLTGWTTAIAADTTIRVIISSVSTCERLTLVLKVQRT